MSKYSHRSIQAQHTFVAFGDTEALSELLNEHSGLYDFLYRVTNNETSANEALERVAKKLAATKYEGDEALFEGWLYRLAVDSLNEPHETVPALKALPPALVEVFLLAHYAKLTPEQIGVALRITSQEAAARIERAILLLQETPE
jgi:DNA-directed RNA polymerase specialized sigma24 family protein